MKKLFTDCSTLIIQHQLSEEELAEVEAGTWRMRAQSSCEGQFWEAFNKFMEDQGYVYVDVRKPIAGVDGRAWTYGCEQNGFYKGEYLESQGPNWEYES